MNTEALRLAVRQTTDALVAAILSPRCAVCARTLDAPIDGPVCEPCWCRVRPLSPPLCLRCGDPLASWRVVSMATAHCPRCRRRPGLVDAGRAAGDYDGALRGILHALKYDGRRTVARRLGAMMRASGAELLAGADCVVPVPLHPWRRLRRGFNQASDLARQLDVPLVRAIRRTGATRPQTGLTAAARRRNVRGAFALAPWMTRSRRRAWLVDRVVVLVDDVRTTGATLEACAAVLKAAGAREVRALTAATATRRGH